jgi:hypothetical protein
VRVNGEEQWIWILARHGRFRSNNRDRRFESSCSANESVRTDSRPNEAKSFCDLSRRPSFWRAQAGGLVAPQTSGTGGSNPSRSGKESRRHFVSEPRRQNA